MMIMMMMIMTMMTMTMMLWWRWLWSYTLFAYCCVLFWNCRYRLWRCILKWKCHFAEIFVTVWTPVVYKCCACCYFITPLRWRHNDHAGVSNHQPHGCLLNRLFRLRSKKTSKLRVTGLCVGNSPGPVNSPHKGPVTRKMFPFDDVIMYGQASTIQSWINSTLLQCFHCHSLPSRP